MIVTFLTYDGLLDPLGKSQILPYLIGLRPFVKKMQIISFEKQDKIKTKEFDNLKCLLKDNNIAWKHHTFTKSKSSLYKLIDIVNFYKSFLGNLHQFKTKSNSCKRSSNGNFCKLIEEDI